MKLLTTLVLLLLFSLRATAGEAETLVAKFPPKTNAEETPLANELAQLGPAGIKEVCGMLVPLGEQSKNDISARFALSALERRANQPGRDADRQMLAAALCTALTSHSDPEIRAFLIARVQAVGDDASVPALAAYLSDDKLYHHALAALEQIGTPRAVAAIEESLAASEGARRVALIRSLGALRAPAQAQAIRASAASPDAALRLTALWALANVGDAGVKELLDKAEQSATTGFEKSRLMSFRLLLIERRFPMNAAESTAAARELIKKYADAKEADVAIASLHLLAAHTPEAAMTDLLAATDHPRADLRNGAFDAANLIKSASATAQWSAKLASSKQPLIKIDLLAFLARRGDISALDAVVAGMRDADSAVGAEAARTAVQLGGEKAIEPLIALLKTPAADAPRIVEILARMPGEKVLASLAAGLKGAPAPAQVAMVDALAGRAARGQKEAVIALVTSSEAGVRSAALRALEKLSDPADAPRLIEVALAATDDAQQQAALKAAVAAAHSGPANVSADEKSAPFLAALAKATAAQRPALLRASAKVGGPKALAAVAADLQSADAAARDASLRALADSSDAGAIEPLLSVASADAKATPAYTPAQQILAIRGVVQVLKVARTSADFSPESAAKSLARAMTAAKRPEEKRLILTGLSETRTLESLAIAATALDDAEIKTEAALAVIKIAAPIEKGQKGLVGPTVAPALEKAIPLCPDAGSRLAASKYLATLKKK